jgi:hypothetical protein
MTTNADSRRLESGGCQGVLFAAGGGTVATVPLARPGLVVTAGRIEYAARCPSCRSLHRHVSLGVKVAPCGTRYELAPRRGRA